MKNIIFAFSLSLFMVSIMGCEEFENSAVPSQETFLPKLTMHGPASIDLPCTATSYVDEGLTALEQGVEIPVTTTITGSYFGSTSVNGPDVYSILYSATNKDGIPGAAERTVFWPACAGDFNTSIAGVYKANVVRNGVVSAQYQNLGPIIIKDLGNGNFQLSDAIGGYYDFGRKFGYHYASTGFVVKALNIPGNSFDFANQTVAVGDFGGELVMTAFSINAANKTIQFTTDWDAGFVFEVTLTQL
jgi:hypothetical protein